MTQAELTDAMTYISAVQMLTRLVERETITKDKADDVRDELRRRLKPCI